MRRLVAITLTAALTCASPLALTACGQQGTDTAAETEADAAADATEDATTEDATADTGEAATQATFSTLKDVFDADGESMTTTYDEQRYVCAFKWAGAWWRVEAELPEGMYDELDAVWVEDQDKVQELLSPLPVADARDLEAPTVEELESFVGKTGAELTASGYEILYGTLVVNDEQTDCTATKGDFEFIVTFDSAVEDENAEDPAAAVADLTVADLAIQSVSWEALEGV